MSNPGACPLMRQLAAVRVSDAERGVHDVLRRHQLIPNVPIQRADLGENEAAKSFPYLKMSSWVKFLLETDRFTRHLCGADSFEKMQVVLPEFWARFEKLYKDHEVFEWARNGRLDLRYAVPVYSHTDEGRTQKKEPLWVFSLHAALGRGTRSFIEKKKHLMPLASNEMGMNFLGNTWTSNYLIATMHKRFSNAHPEAMENLLKLIAEDMAMLASEGVSVGGHHVWLIHVGTTGDLPALGKLGGFVRSYSHVARRPSSKKAGEGICHLCLGGQEEDARTGADAFPFEDVGPNPIWEPSMHVKLPWQEEPVILSGLPLLRKEMAAWFNLDLWHCYHLGLAKHWVANSLVCIIESNLLPAASVENKLSSVSEMYLAFCQEKGIALWVTEISRETLTWPQSSSVPIGKWNKASASTTMMLFLDHYCQKMVIGKTQDPLLLMIALWQSFSSSFVNLFFVFL